MTKSILHKVPVMKLLDLLEEFTEKNKNNENHKVYSVTNDRGFVVSTENFSKEVYSKNLKTYKKVKLGDFAYNPSRINVGSIDYFKMSDIGLVSPLYVTFKVEDVVDHQYLKYFLKSPIGNAQIRNNTSGSVRDTLSFKNLCKISIPLPSLEEQKCIVRELDTADALRQKRKQALALLDDYLNAVFLEMFGDPVTNPKGWTTVPIINISKKITDGEHLNPQFTDEGMYMVMAGNVLENTVDLSSAKKIDIEKGNLFRKKCDPEKADILLVSRGATIGRLCKVDTSEQFCLMGSVILIKPNSDIVNSAFLTALMKHPAIYMKLFNSSGSSAQQAIYLKDVKKITCIVPPLLLQNQFALIVVKVEEFKKEMEAQSRHIKVYFNSLMQYFFNETVFNKR